MGFQSTSGSVTEGALALDFLSQVNHPTSIRPARRLDLLLGLSGAFDLAEGQAAGHAARVVAVADAVGERLRLRARERRIVRYAALLHDAGIALRSLPDGSQPFGGHLATGAWVADALGLSRDVQEAIRNSHERWDGGGRPYGRSMREIPRAALLVSAAHWLTDVVEGVEQPLRARATALRYTPADVAPLVGQEIADALFAELRDDALWMTYWADDLTARIADGARGEPRPTARAVEQVATVMGMVIDLAVREPGRAERVAWLAQALARRAGFDTQECRAVGVAARLIDLGHLGVPRDVLEKPDILTLQEMETMRGHAVASARMVDAIPGFEEIAWWVECHHERPDGRGYPEMLDRTAIPVASRVLSVADAYCALRATRPFRESLPVEDALEVLRGGAGTQFDATVVSWLPQPARDLERALPLDPGARTRRRAVTAAGS